MIGCRKVGSKWVILAVSEALLKLVHHQPDVTFAITGHGQGHVLLNGQRVEQSLAVSPSQILQPWAESFEALGMHHFTQLLELKPELVVLGTGGRLRHPPLEFIRPLIEAGVGLEVMDTKAACRTYLVLSSEGRQVVAALLLS
jgi:uncharacterized protein